MSGWLTKAAGALRGEQPEQPEPFDLVCVCGVSHSGLRRRKSRRIICRQCGTALFVLPRDPYPTPLAALPRPPKRRKKSGKKGMAAVPPDAPPRFQQVATNVFQGSEKVGRKVASAGAGFGSRLSAWFLAFLAIWTPLRLLLLGCIAVCGATVAYTLLVDRSEQAVLELKAANVAARQFLAEQKIHDAHEQLSVAVVALDKLDRRDDPLAREIRQLHRETSALREALPISPLQVVFEADAAQEDGQAEQWQHTFETQYRNRWVIVDGAVSRNTSGAERGQYSVALPLRVGPARRRITMHVALPELDALSKAGKPRAAVFAVQLVGCDLSSDTKTWKLRTHAQSAFLWGTLDNYLAAGFALATPEDRQQVEQVLAEQQRALGLTATDPAPTENSDGTTAAWDDDQGQTE